MDKYERRRLRLIKFLNDECDGKVATLARRLEKSDSYVHRMLYEPGKPSKKRIGEDSVDLILAKTGLDLDARDDVASSMATDPKEARLRTLYHALDPARRDRLLTFADDLMMEKLNEPANTGEAPQITEKKSQSARIG